MLLMRLFIILEMIYNGHIGEYMDSLIDIINYSKDIGKDKIVVPMYFGQSETLMHKVEVYIHGESTNISD